MSKIQINHQPDATIFHFIILTFIYSSTCFGRSHAHLQELNNCSSSLCFYLCIVVIAVLCSWSGRPARPRTQHGYHQAPTVNQRLLLQLLHLLTMGMRMPETCWDVFKRQAINLRSCCILLVDSDESSTYLLWLHCLDCWIERTTHLRCYSISNAGLMSVPFTSFIHLRHHTNNEIRSSPIN
jgi:hypothetical protein